MARDPIRRSEGIANVGAALGGRELALRSSRSDASKPARPNRNVEMAADPPGEERSLIEPALTLACSRERHRNQRVDGIRQRRGTLLGGEIAERARQRAPARELQGVDRV